MTDTVITPSNGMGNGSPGVVITGNGGGHGGYGGHGYGLSCDPHAATNTLISGGFEALANRNLTSDIFLNGENVLREVNNVGRNVQADIYATHKDLSQSIHVAFCNTQLEASKNLASTIAAITQAAKEAAECCCETQKLVISQSAETRQLIANNQSLNLAVQLADCKVELAALKAAKAV